MAKHTCECGDVGCPVHKGKEHCEKGARVCLRRVDMDDETGTLFCEACAADAQDSGLFGDHDIKAWIHATKGRK